MVNQELEAAKHNKFVQQLFQRELGAHAILLYGIAGNSIKLLGDALSQFWLCKAPHQEGACGSCIACAAFAGSGCVDLLRVVPAGRSRLIKLGAVTERKVGVADDSGDDDKSVTPIQRFLQTPPLMARHKVIRIEQAERMNQDAANALLKTLEEPPPYTKFLLQTDTLRGLLPTVVSRCMTVACEQVEEGEEPLSAQLKNKRVDFEELFEQVLRAQPIRALKLAEQFRELVENLDDEDSRGARASYAVGLELFASWLTRHAPFNPEAIQLVSEAHRRILGNANASLTLDSMFLTLLSGKNMENSRNY